MCIVVALFIIILAWIDREQAMIDSLIWFMCLVVSILSVLSAFMMVCCLGIILGVLCAVIQDLLRRKP